jgi:integrase
MSAFELRDWYATPRYDGKPVENFNTNSFKKAAERAGVRGLRWHDLRHTGAFWAVQNGVTLQELMALCGWKSYAMVLRYAPLVAGQHYGSGSGGRYIRRTGIAELKNG